jgi:hypothetical protein
MGPSPYKRDTRQTEQKLVPFTEWPLGRHRNSQKHDSQGIEARTPFHIIPYPGPYQTRRCTSRKLLAHRQWVMICQLTER